ncbi:rhodanese-like domain-containing protein [Brachybacterium sp. AOP3-A1-3]|uniref:rhodanese-like domain-containing protein n=1 Tax=Brachybacterium sp. AOP3-A1-3 TaxID=3457699 RepID=UPI004034F19F
MTEAGAGRRRAEAPASHTIEEILDAARLGVERIEPAALSDLVELDAHVIDIRPAATRESEGHIPGATVIDRLVLEWRLDPSSAHRMDSGPEHDDTIVVVCNEGYYSSLAARDLRDLGFENATDLIGGFRAYRDAGLPTDTEATRVVV